MNYYTIKLLKSQAIIILLLVLSYASILMGYNGFFIPEIDKNPIWFQRSGSIAVILSIFAELFFIKESLGLAELEEENVKKRYKPLIVITNILAFVSIVVGTFVWGYGDLIYIHIKN